MGCMLKHQSQISLSTESASGVLFLLRILVDSLSMSLGLGSEQTLVTGLDCLLHEVFVFFSHCKLPL